MPANVFQENEAKAKQGLAYAQYNLGWAYANGEGVTQDYGKAIEWYQKAAKQDYPQSQYDLGWVYANGKGVSQNDATAAVWYRKAADQYAPAQFALGYMYLNGRGVEQSDIEAVTWFQKAAYQGIQDAKITLEWMRQQNRCAAQDESTEEEDIEEPLVETGNANLFQENEAKAEQGLAYAQYNLGWAYANGDGVLQDHGKAIEWYQKAAKQNYPQAQYDLGWAYANGKGVSQNDATAAVWYRKAADQYGLAQFALGYMYLNGRGVEQSDIEAVTWFQKAADQGVQDARITLEWMHQQNRGTAQNEGIGEPLVGVNHIDTARNEDIQNTQIAICMAEVNTLPSFPTYSRAQLETACTTENGRALVSSFKDHSQREQNNIRASLNMNILSAAISAAGILVLLALLYRWLKEPQVPEKIRIIDSESVKKAIKEDDCDFLKRLLQSDLDLKGWSFADIDIEDVAPFTKEDLQKKGIIVTLEELLQASERALAPDSNLSSEYIVRLCWGIEYLLAEWANTHDPFLNETTINQLNGIAKTELHRRYHEGSLPDAVMAYININKNSSNGIPALSEEDRVTNAVELSFKEWRETPNKFATIMTLTELLPEYKKAAERLREKESAQRNSILLAARSIGFIANTQHQPNTSNNMQLTPNTLNPSPPAALGHNL